ncbi:MAG: hypothetical protein RIR51_116 [Bacteroidota bacterium]|jgi:tRNA 2-selenouridine synthase
MAKIITIEEFLSMDRNIPVVDVRSPGEFEHAHIPGAYSLPLFNNLERADIGTLYKNSGKEIAVEKGLEYVGPKMKILVAEAKKLAKEKEIIIHCWRGGMRSGSMAWLLETAGLKVYLIKGGYKSYRQWIQKQFKRQIPILVIGGKTGSGKTEIIQELKAQGFQTLDLEGMANHRGSSFGHIGLPIQPSTEEFENTLGEELFRLDFSKPIFVEDESRSIGRVYQPNDFYNQLREAKVLFLDIPVEARIPHLVKVYGSYSKEELGKSIDKIKKRLGGQWHLAAHEALEQGDLEEVVRIVLNYYDKAYLFGLSKRNQDNVIRIQINSLDQKEQVKNILPYL